MDQYAAQDHFAAISAARTTYAGDPAKAKPDPELERWIWRQSASPAELEAADGFNSGLDRPSTVPNRRQRRAFMRKLARR